MAPLLLLSPVTATITKTNQMKTAFKQIEITPCAERLAQQASAHPIYFTR